MKAFTLEQQKVLITLTKIPPSGEYSVYRLGESLNKLRALLALSEYTSHSLADINFWCDNGLCDSVGKYLQLSNIWEESTGNRYYPVKCPFSEKRMIAYALDLESPPEREMFENTHNKYIGPYGRSRLRLARFYVGCIEEILKLRGENIGKEK